MTPFPNDTLSMIASGLSGTMSRQCAWFGLRRAHRDDASPRCALGCLDEERAVDNGALRLTRNADRHDLFVDPAALEKLIEVDEPQVVGLRIDPVAKHEPMTVTREASARPPGCRQVQVLSPW